MSAAVDMFRINNNNSNEVAKSSVSSKDPMSITPDDAIFSMSFDAAATDSESGIQVRVNKTCIEFRCQLMILGR